MRKFLQEATAVVVLSSCATILSHAASADPLTDFYKGKEFEIYVGTGESSIGATNQYARAVAQVIGRYLPANPTVVLRLMPGAGGVKAANFVYNIAPQDGTVLGFDSRGFINQALVGTAGAQFDPTKFQWIGSAATGVSVGAVYSANTDVKTIQDATKQEVVVGATAPGQDAVLFPVVMNQLIGTKFKVVSGYSSTTEVKLAMQRGEVQGQIGWTWGDLNAGDTADWLSTGKVRVIVQMGLEKSPHIPIDVPLMLDLARNPTDRQLMEVIAGPSATGYPSFVGPGVPMKRVEAIRIAFRKTMADPEFKEITRQQKLEVDPIDGEYMTKAVQQLYAVPPDVMSRARTLLSTP
jgi:tripartite-type tricarboxylate transporter receptor subunit TctC